MKNYLLLFALLAATTALRAQGIGLGLRAGATFANISVDDDDFDSDNITGLSVGVLVPILLSDNFAIQPELSLVQKGYSASDETFGIDLDVRYNYIEVPVLFQGLFGTDDLKFYVQAGPAYGYAAGGTIKSDIAGVESEVDIDFEEPGNEDFNRGDLSGIAGAGVRFGFDNLKLLIDGRYGFSLSDSDGTDVTVYRNRGLTLSAGLLFTIGN